MEKKRYDRGKALAVATSLCQSFHGATSRLVIAGSLRRQKPQVGDIEILYIPKFVAGVSNDFFTTAPLRNASDDFIQCLRETDTLVPRPNINGHTCWGEKNKLAIHKLSGIPVDLFATTEECWWVSLVIRTGGKETNLALTTGAQKMGRKLHAYGAGVEVLRTGEMLIPQSEQDVFAFCGCKYLEPTERK